MLPVTSQLRAASPFLGRDLRRGATGGLFVGAALGVVSAAFGFPEWALVMWSFVEVATMIMVPFAIILRLAGGLAVGYLNRPVTGGATVDARTALSMLRPLDTAAAALAVGLLVLILTWRFGDGRLTAF